MKKKYLNLITSPLDLKKKYKNIFFLGHFCISDKLETNKFFEDNTLAVNKTNVDKEYTYLKKTTEKLFQYLKNKLNEIHKVRKDEKYWRIIIFPWTCYYVATLYNRWKIVYEFKKQTKKELFNSIEYIFDENLFEIENTSSWCEITQSDEFNSFLFNKIFKFQRINNIKYKKKRLINKNFLKKKSLSIFKKILLFYEKLIININNVYFDKIYFLKFKFLKLCINNLLFPSKNLTTFENISFNKKYNKLLRNDLTYLFKKNTFENFLYKEIINFLPKTFVEYYGLILKRKLYKKIKKKLIIGMYSIHHNDYFKIYVAESIQKGSKYIHSKHGAGCHVPVHSDTLFNHFYKISDKIIQQLNKKTKLSKEIFLPIQIFKKNKKIKSNKLLICFHTVNKYVFRPGKYNLTFDYNLKNFQQLSSSLHKLSPKIKNDLKFRNKENHNINYEKKFEDIFGIGKVENSNSKPFRKSIAESKVVICYLAQTAFTEVLYNNIPVILIGNKSIFFSSENSAKIYEKFKNSSIIFDQSNQAFNFLNNNWEKIDEWWFSKNTQNARNSFLKLYYREFSENDFNKWNNLIKKETKTIKL